MLDPLWTTERLSVVHDGAESTRAAKITRIADNLVVQGHVRVCLKEWDELNCGRCAKCLRTMAALDLLDQLPAVRTFPDEIDLDALRDVKLKDANDLFQFEDCLRLAHSRSGHDELTAVLEDLVDGYRSRVEVPS